MRKLFIYFLLFFTLCRCASQENSYPFENKGEPIASVELLYYPWIEDDRKPFMEFVLIRTLEEDEIPVFMEALYSLETKRVGPTPPCNYGRYIARVNYENGNIENFATRHIELVEKGKEAHAIGYYVFTGDAFEELFLEYAGDISHLR